MPILVDKNVDDFLSICMVSDFFYPNMGGVENHIYNLSQALMVRGHKVIVITHSYGDRIGVHWLSNFLKVYYLPLPVLHSQCTWTALWAPSMIWIRNILYREGINHLHAHQAHSSLCHDSIMLARILGIPTTFTDHSLFNFDDVSSIVTNKLLRITLSPPEITVICVSHTGKENTCLRAHISSNRVWVIPNAVIGPCFQPLESSSIKEDEDDDANNKDKDITNNKKKTIVVLSRLVYRKGADLLVNLIPQLLERNPFLNIIIAGEGPKRVDLEQMRDQYSLHDRVKMVGGIKSGEDCRNHLIKGDLFLNTSLTEAFCISILEAASCGLMVVSTNVGGIKEVLPSDMIILSKEVNVKSIIEAIEEGLGRIITNSKKKWENHHQISSSYNWHKIAERTEVVYLKSNHKGIPKGGGGGSSWLTRQRLLLIMEDYFQTGKIMGYLAVMVVLLQVIILAILDFFRPPHGIDMALTLDREAILTENEKEKHQR